MKPATKISVSYGIKAKELYEWVMQICHIRYACDNESAIYYFALFNSESFFGMHPENEIDQNKARSIYESIEERSDIYHKAQHCLKLMDSVNVQNSEQFASSSQIYTD
jgi:hypothetical protein